MHDIRPRLDRLTHPGPAKPPGLWQGTGDDIFAAGDAARKQTTVIIDRRAFSRECLARALRAANADAPVLTFTSVQEWLQGSAQPIAASLIVICAGSRMAQDGDLFDDIELLMRGQDLPPVVLLSDEENPEAIIAALDSGVRGYIPTSLPLEVVVEAMQLVRAGGLYVPASSLLSYRQTLEAAAHPPADPIGEVFTARQTAVLKALREGKANKLIAYELNMRESTVKVHVRNIMKKLKARNRTEVAYKTSELFAEQERQRSGRRA